MTLTEKTAYIKGLMEGLDFKADTPEKKVLAAVVDLLDDLAIAVSEAEEDIEYLNDYVEELDSDLGDVESDIYECEDDDDCDCDCCCDDDDDDYYEAVCPKCGEVIYLDEDLLECDDILCPKCGEKLICELDECELCDADCCDDCDKK